MVVLEDMRWSGMIVTMLAGKMITMRRKDGGCQQQKDTATFCKKKEIAR